MQVNDNAANAWRNCVQAPLHELDGDFVSEYRALLDEAGENAMEAALPEAWAAMGHQMVPVRPWREDAANMHDFTYYSAWDRAAATIDGRALLTAIGLDGEYLALVD